MSCIVTPQNSYVEVLTPQCPVTLFGNRVSADDQDKVGSLGLALNQFILWPYKGRN